MTPIFYVSSNCFNVIIPLIKATTIYHDISLIYFFTQESLWFTILCLASTDIFIYCFFLTQLIIYLCACFSFLWLIMSTIYSERVCPTTNKFPPCFAPQKSFTAKLQNRRRYHTQGSSPFQLTLVKGSRRGAKYYPLGEEGVTLYHANIRSVL